MCMVILLVAIGLLVFYLDGHLANWNLVERLDAHSEVTLALGWEIIPAFWPVILLSILGTLFFVMLYQRVFNKQSLGCVTCPTDNSEQK